MSKFIVTGLLGFMSRLRYPYLFAISLTLFVVDLIIPDVIPFVDEILLALFATFLAAMKKRPRPGGGSPR